MSIDITHCSFQIIPRVCRKVFNLVRTDSVTSKYCTLSWRHVFFDPPATSSVTKSVIDGQTDRHRPTASTAFTHSVER